MSSLIAILISLGLEGCGTDEEQNAVSRDARSHSHVAEVITKVAKKPTSRPVDATTTQHRPGRSPAAAARKTAKRRCRSARRVTARRPRVAPKRATKPTTSSRPAASRAKTSRRASAQSQALALRGQGKATQGNSTWVPEPIRTDPRIIAPRVGTPFGGFPR